MWHVLEHLENPAGVLERLKELLAPGGVVFIEVPNADDALAALYGCRAFQDFTYWECHLYLYNSRTLDDLIRKAGLRTKFLTQIQRYPLANHLYWLVHGKPGGHVEWSMLDSPELNHAYEKMLAGIGRADTLLAEVCR